MVRQKRIVKSIIIIGIIGLVSIQFLIATRTIYIRSGELYYISDCIKIARAPCGWTIVSNGKPDVIEIFYIKEVTLLDLNKLNKSKTYQILFICVSPAGMALGERFRGTVTIYDSKEVIIIGIRNSCNLQHFSGYWDLLPFLFLGEGIMVVIFFIRRIRRKEKPRTLFLQE